MASLREFICLGNREIPESTDDLFRGDIYVLIHSEFVTKSQSKMIYRKTNFTDIGHAFRATQINRNLRVLM